MSDNLTVFGTDYTGVTGIKATGTGNGTLTYIRPAGTKAITGSGTTDVTEYASASVAAGSATASATKGTVSNHSISVTPSVTRTAGWVTAGSANGTAVTVSASELVSGSETKTANGTYDVTNLASVVVDVQGGTTPVSIGTATHTVEDEYDRPIFSNLLGEPTSFIVIAHDTISPSSSKQGAVFVWDGGSGYHGQTITNTSGSQVTYDAGDDWYPEITGNYLSIIGIMGLTFPQIRYDLIYTYGGSAACICTDEVQVGSGATSITFSNLEDEPLAWYLIFKSDFSTSSGYQRVIAVANDGTDTYGLEMDSAAHYSDAHWSSSYSNGSLTISSQGTNAGGYFHQPGYYELVYVIDATGNYQSKTVTPTQSTQQVTADTGYDALKKVTVNPIPSEYVIPTGNLPITSNGTGIDVANYATVSVAVPTGGGVNVAKTTWSNSSTSTVSHTFSNLQGTPRMAVLRCTASLTRSSNQTYYYIADIVWDGTDAYGNYHLRSSGAFTNVPTATSGTRFTVTTGTNSITFASSATSRSSAPGAFYNGSYELTYVY